MKFLTILGFVCALTFSSLHPAFAAGKKPKGPPPDKKPHMEMTAEQRTKMAELHANMSACLKSEKSVEDCHKEMAEAYKEAMGEKEGCPLQMGQHGKHGKHDKHHGEKCDGSCEHHACHHEGKDAKEPKE